MSVKLHMKHHLEFLSLTGGCTGSSESTLVKIPNCWISHVAAHIIWLISDYYVCAYNAKIVVTVMTMISVN